MKKYAWIILVFTLSKPVSATPPIQWYSGSVVLSDTREVLTGEIAVEELFDMILFKSSSHEQLQVFNAHRLESFYFYDSIQDLNRKFISHKQQLPIGHEYALYEVVVGGTIKVLRKLRNYGNENLSGANDYLYYTWNANKLEPLMFFYTKVFPELLERGGKLVENYQNENHLDANQQADAIRLIVYFNSITVKQAAEIASL